MIWIQVRDVRTEHAGLAAAGPRSSGNRRPSPGARTQMWIQGPDGARIVLAGVPAGHPLRRDPRPGDGRVRANARVQAGTSEAAGALT
jgi:hypothetical protein